jgi:uncharacterized protein YjbJ (UPF0337 family)
LQGVGNGLDHGLHLLPSARGNAPEGDWLRRAAGNRIAEFALTRRDIAVFKKERRMNWDQVQGNWKQFKGKVQQQWGSLTDDDLDKVEGRQEELAGRIQERYGKSREEAEREVNEWLAKT